MFELHQFGTVSFLVRRSAGSRGDALYLLDATSGEIQLICENCSPSECAAYMRAVSGEETGSAVSAQFNFIVGYFVSQITSYLIVCDGESLGSVLQNTVYRPTRLKFIQLKMRRATQELASACGLKRTSFLNRMLSEQLHNPNMATLPVQGSESDIEQASEELVDNLKQFFEDTQSTLFFLDPEETPVTLTHESLLHVDPNYVCNCAL